MDKSVDKSVAIAKILELENLSFQETLVGTALMTKTCSVRQE
jgi:hypothetical protein